MDITSITQLITTVGFPIVICLLMAWYINKLNDNHAKEITRLNELHNDETAKMTEALNNNTLALQRLCDNIKGGETE